MGDRSSPVQNNSLPPPPKSPHIITIQDVARKRGSKDFFPKTGIYAPLHGRQIRLLTVFPGKMGTKMCCSLATTTLSETHLPKYEALSYVWGDPQSSRLIWVNEKILPITKNLDSALENLRYSDKPRVLWIDAICINQSDLSERSQQVLLMKQIYRLANRVLIWLGLQDPDSDLAFDLLHSIYTVDEGPRGSVRKRRGWSITTRQDISSEETRVLTNADFRPDELQSHHLNALKRTFSQRSWWKRIWIIQEAVYARNVAIVCGQRSISWDLLEKLTKSDNFGLANNRTAQLASNMETAIIIATLRNTLAPGIQEKMPNTGSWSKYSHRMLGMISGRRSIGDSPGALTPAVQKPFKTTLDSLVVVFETSACTDPRDRIYGLLSLADNLDLEILPDYTQPPAAVFAEATKSIIYSNSSLDILAYVHRSAQSNMSTKEQKQPTWAPDFSAVREYSTLISSSAPNSPYNASRGFEFNRELTSEPFCPLTLTIKASECDKIAEVLHSVDTSEPDWKAWFREWGPPKRDSDEYTMSYGYNMDSYWRTLMLDITRPVGWPARITGNDLIIYRHLFANWSTSQLGQDLRQEVSSPANLDRYERIRDSNRVSIQDFDDVLGDHLHGWSFCRTVGGKLGWVPNVAREGDAIHIAAGSSLPLILRLQKNTFSVFQLVGTAYIHGIMDGEIVDWQGSRSKFREGESPGLLDIQFITVK